MRDAINNKTPTKTESVLLGDTTNTTKAKKTRVSIAKKEGTGAKRTPKKAVEKTNVKTLAEKPTAQDAAEPSAIRRSFADLFGKKLKPVIDQV